ncbi:zinc finger, C3HC4 type (RING finger) domain-containing protein, partial [Toxoplasma gondii ARI]
PLLPQGLRRALAGNKSSLPHLSRQHRQHPHRDAIGSHLAAGGPSRPGITDL